MIHIDPANIGTFALYGVTVVSVIVAGAMSIVAITARRRARQADEARIFQSTWAERWKVEAADAHDAFTASETEADRYRQKANDLQADLRALNSKYFRLLGAKGNASPKRRHAA